MKFPRKLPIVTLTLGGGGDGWNYLEIFLEMVERKLCSAEFNFLLLAGPFASADLMARGKALAAQRDNFSLLGFTSRADSVFAGSDLVISMGGYNSTFELLSMRKYPLLLPRITPRQEQLIRAQLLQKKGYCELLHPDEVSAERLAWKIQEMIAYDRERVPVLSARGLPNILKFLESLP